MIGVRTCLVSLIFGSIFLSSVYSTTVAPDVLRCKGILCPAPVCGAQEPYVPHGECCAVCPKDSCSGVVCPVLNCTNKAHTKDECCPVCSKGVLESLISCATVKCIKPKCPVSHKPKGKCCPVCTNGGRTCDHNGQTIHDGNNIKVDECNTCTCHDGKLKCTSNVCKQSCHLNGETIADGGSIQVDCNTCSCTRGVVKCDMKDCLPGCYHEGEYIENGGSAKIGCNWCTCTNDIVKCSKHSCSSAEKAGQCPAAPSSIFTFCPSTCDHDASCPGDEKCCNNGCGKSCMDPVTKECQGVVCPYLRCTRRQKLPNQCCSFCQPLKK